MDKMPECIIETCIAVKQIIKTCEKYMIWLYTENKKAEHSFNDNFFEFMEERNFMFEGSCKTVSCWKIIENINIKMENIK